MNLNRFFVFILVFMTSLSAGTIDIGSMDKPTNILKDVEVYIDKENAKSFKHIQKESGSIFVRNSSRLLHLGYSSDAIWLKFKIKNSSEKKIKKVLVLSNNMLDHIDLYSKNENGYTKKTIGVFSDSTFNENLRKFYFNLSLNRGETKEFYLKVSSLSSALYFELDLMSKDELYQIEMHSQLTLALFFGAILSLIVYNLFIYFFTKDTAYLYYSLYQLFVIWNHTSYSGMNLYIIPLKYVAVDAYLIIFYLSSLTLFAILFTRKLLEIHKYKKIDFIMKILMVISIGFVLFTSEDFYPLEIVVAVLLLSLTLMVLISFYLLYKKVSNAKYIVVGWSIALLGWIMLGSRQLGTWSLLENYPYFYEFSIFVEAILFSIALASKLNKTKELEHSVSTNKVLTRELHHRVKNNMQFIISMYRLKLAKYESSEISNSLKEVEGTIQAMSATHEMLYSQEIVSSLDTQEYFTTLVQRLKNSYESTDVEIKLKVSSSLDIDSSIYVGIILNELITNSFKYAFNAKRGQITISLFEKNSKFVLTVEDNGKGYDTQKECSGFGLELVKSLVEDELQGVFTTDVIKGTKHQISW